MGFAPGRPVAGIVVKYYSVERATTLSADDVVPLSTDYRVVAFRRYVRDYAIAMCWKAKNEMEKYMLDMASFERGVRKCNNVVFGNKTEPFRMVPAHRRPRTGHGLNTDPLRL